jgi:hypothetical protein
MTGPVEPGRLVQVPNPHPPGHPAYASAQEMYANPGRLVSVESGWAIVDLGRWGQVGLPVAALVPLPDADVVSDGYHTLGELYDHRRALFAALARALPAGAWRSRRHHPEDQPIFDGYFVAGINLPDGVVSYHFTLARWNDFRHVPELHAAPKWDGTGSRDSVARLLEWASSPPPPAARRPQDLDVWRRICLHAYTNLPDDTAVTMAQVDQVLTLGARGASATDTAAPAGAAYYDRLSVTVAERTGLDVADVDAILTVCCDDAADQLAAPTPHTR